MVVVPAQGPSGPYAIGKYEITVGEYNEFCRLSGHCQPLSDQDSGNPARGIDAERVQAYATWLSEMTGSLYRLPTVGEWAHAASAEGTASKRSVNCRVTRGGAILKGQSVLAVRAGQGNRWGLVNPIGNVQELVRDTDGLRAVGGSYADPLSSCDVSLQKPVETPDELTGFRLVRELG
jgi:formylglycine-generating enzyme required for sulfatase activity